MKRAFVFIVLLVSVEKKKHVAFYWGAKKPLKMDGYSVSITNYSSFYVSSLNDR
jgi:hypothetical protein